MPNEYTESEGKDQGFAAQWPNRRKTKYKKDPVKRIAERPAL